MTGRQTIDERASATLETVLLAPVMIVLVLFVVGLGRIVSAQGRVEDATRDAAREASLARSATEATAAAARVVELRLGNSPLHCAEPVVAVDTAAFAPGGDVTVNVSCTTRLSDLVIAGFPGERQLRAQARVPLEPYRAFRP